MGIIAKDGNGALFTYTYGGVDPVYRAAGTITAAQGAGTAKDILLITGPTTPTIGRLLGLRYALQLPSTAGQALSVISLNRVVAAPTGQTNVLVTPTQHDKLDAAQTTTINITPSTTQTAGTSPTVLATSVLSTDTATAEGVIFGSLLCGPESGGKPITFRSGDFITLRLSVALTTNGTFAFDLMWSESAT